MKTNIHIALASAACMALSDASAQQQIDIALYEGSNGTIDVRVIPHGDLTGVLSSVVFTLKWDAASNATIGQPLQSDEAQAVIPMRQSGDVHEHGGSNYQIFSGFGMESLAAMGKQWVVGQQYTIATLTVNGYAEVELASDDWTSDLHNNGDYFISIGGNGRTGAIAKASAWGGVSVITLTMLPNPNNGEKLFITITDLGPDVTSISVDITDAKGEHVVIERLAANGGTLNTALDLKTKLASGIYVVSFGAGAQTFTERLMVAD